MSSAITNVRRSKAAFNLLNLGFSPQDTIHHMRLWTEKQLASSGSNISKILSNASVDSKISPPLSKGRLFISFHYSIYAVLYRIVGNLSKERIVYAVIGEQTDEQSENLKQLALMFNINIRFVLSSPSLIKTLRRSLKEGNSAIILIDVPWATKYQAKKDTQYPIEGGSFLGLSTIPRLLNLIDEDHRYLLTTYAEQNIAVKEYEGSEVAAAFKWFGKQLIQNPSSYERLDSFHTFFEFDNFANSVVTFTVGDERYAVHSDCMRSWSIGPSQHLDALANGTCICTDPSVVAAFTKLTGGPLDAILSI